MPVYESLLHLLRASLPEFIGSLMTAIVLAVVGWSAKKTRDRLLARHSREEVSRMPQTDDETDHQRVA